MQIYLTPNQFKELLESTFKVSVKVKRLSKRYRYAVSYQLGTSTPVYQMNYEIFSTKMSMRTALGIIDDIMENMKYHVVNDYAVVKETTDED